MLRMEVLWAINLPNNTVISRLWPCGLHKMGRSLCWGKAWCRLEVLHKWHSKDELTFPTAISQMFVCWSLSQRTVFGNPWTSTPGLPQDSVIVARLFYGRDGISNVGYSPLSRCFCRVIFSLRRQPGSLLTLPAARWGTTSLEKTSIAFLSCTAFPA